MIDMCGTWRLNVLEQGGVSFSPNDLTYFNKNFVGHAMSASWHGPPSVSIFRRSGKLNDFLVWHTAAPVVSTKALNILEATSGGNFECFEFATLRGRRYFAINVTKIIDCINFSDSVIKFYGGDNYGIPRSITLRRDVIMPHGIFKMESIPGYVFVSDSLAERLVNEGLTGFGLTRLSTDVLAKAVRGESLNEFPRPQTLQE